MSKVDPSVSASDFDTAELEIENIGGIEHSIVTIDPGVTIFSGRNATNRTSLLSALGGVLGGSTATLRSDADQGSITLALGSDEYTREYRRSGPGVDIAGSPYTDDETMVDSFVALLEDNPARRAVERGDDLRNVIMEPVDTDAIETRIDELQAEKRRIEEEIERVENRRSELPSLENRRQSLQEEIDEIADDITDLEEEISSFEMDLETASEAEEIMEELNDKRQELTQVENQIEVKRAERDALAEDLENITQELEELPGSVDDDLDEIETDLREARERKRSIDETINSLSTIVDFNEELLADGLDIPSVGVSDVTAELAPSEQRDVICWTCGSTVQHSNIREQLDNLEGVIEEKRERRSSVESRIQELQNKMEAIETTTERRAQLERQISETEQKLETREKDIDDLEQTKATLEEAVADLEAEAEDTPELRESDLLERHERISELEYKKGQREQQLADVEAEIEEIENLPDKQNLESQATELREEIEQERDRIESLEKTAIEAFNEHMNELLDILEYKNIARLWIERKTTTSRGRTNVSETSFDLHLVREAGDGTGYEDTVANLSESEREVLGLVVALAGYLVHDVYDTVPFMILDSLEAIDAERIAKLVDHFASYTPYLVVALLPEDAAVLGDNYDQITADALSS